MFALTENNHLRLGYANIKQGESSRLGFVSRIGECARKPNSAMEESVRAAHLIGKNFGNKLVLCLSGGVDSRAMAHAFLTAKVPFTVAIARYGPNVLNRDDIEGAFEFCETHDIHYQIYDFNMIDFYINQQVHLKMTELYECRSPQLAMHLELANRIYKCIDGVPVFSWNPTEINVVQGRVFVLLPNIPQGVYLNYFRKVGRPGIPYFFAYTPEQIYAFWSTPEAIRRHRQIIEYFEAVKNSSADPWTKEVSYLGKLRKYQEGGFDVEAPPAKKTGFEQTKVFFEDHFRGQARDEGYHAWSAYDYFFRRPMQNMVTAHRYPDCYVQMVSKRHFPNPELFQTEP